MTVQPSIEQPEVVGDRKDRDKESETGASTLAGSGGKGAGSGAAAATLSLAELEERFAELQAVLHDKDEAVAKVEACRMPILVRKSMTTFSQRRAQMRTHVLSSSSWCASLPLCLCARSLRLSPPLSADCGVGCAHRRA